ncbi:leucine--tRNA ligase, cytoplasmic [Cimex lectularius]|uniref:leucine--tRNA ligase n=1 Tax=Cimex lectularius TaxID=79782 RepID=A0A8I6S452_CIMLE|nr:leucine--tRNA ligase, cytoplasmic [Cimex lectularius]
MERKGTFKVDYLRSIEKDVQEKWNAMKLYEVDAPPEGVNREKYFVTFPFPYMNGKLHLGHTFSLSKCEFAVRYQRLKGKLCLFPFGFHATGMPIKACADKLKREMEDYGYPPKFPEESVVVEQQVDSGPLGKAKSKKSKALAKTGAHKYQWNIMKSIGLNDQEIKKFCDAEYWLEYFPPLAKQDLMNIGLHVDWRRTFITTDVNKYFDSFVQWQFRLLKKLGKVKFGERYTIYSPRDGQACMDHDRANGEGVGPQEYTLIKLELDSSSVPKSIKNFVTKQVYLVAATLRPETMYGQTNCWIHPDIEYICFETAFDDFYICTLRAATNMSFQGFTKTQGSIPNYVTVKGSELVGAEVRAPLSQYKSVFVLPMMTIKPDKGTGIVTSVPSDSPDDYINLEELRNNTKLRATYKLQDSMVMPFNAVSIIDVPVLGKLCAVTACEQFKVKSPNDSKKLEEAKELAYQKGFYDGIMLVGEFAGKKIQDVKKLVKSKLISLNQAKVYYEPEKEVVSRSGEQCVVALCNQWYLDYGEESWKVKTKECLSKLNTYHDEVRKNFEFCLDWLHEYACSRKYGLGSRLPWDNEWLIESLSDSTIYMAYYTIAHFLQDGLFKGPITSISGISPKDMLDTVWDYIFLDKPLPNKTTIDVKVLQAMKREFTYWYPVDLRCSGKDLIQNHLTFFMYNHCAVWNERPDLWPQSIRANGHLLLNSAKMSKSEGNFLTLAEAVEKYGADGMRLALADAGDSIEDANFVSSVADSGILRLYTFIEWVKEMIDEKNSMREGKPNTYTFHDKAFLSEMNLKINETDSNYSKLLFKEALKTGFFEFQAVRDKYREMTAFEGMHGELVMQFIKNQAIILAPICPHVAEYVYSTLLNEPSSVVDAPWPTNLSVDYDVIRHSQYIMDAAHTFRLQLKTYINQMNKGKSSQTSKPYKANIWVASQFPLWQQVIIDYLQQIFDDTKSLPNNREIAAQLCSKPELKSYAKRVMPFAQMLREKIEKDGISVLNTHKFVDEMVILRMNEQYLKTTLGVDELSVHSTSEAGVPEKILNDTSPGCPYITFETGAEINLTLINPQPLSGCIKQNIIIRHDMTYHDLREALECDKSLDIDFWRWTDPLKGPREIPVSDVTKGKTLIPRDSVITIDQSNKSFNLLSGGNVSPLGRVICYIVNNLDA